MLKELKKEIYQIKFLMKKREIQRIKQMLILVLLMSITHLKNFIHQDMRKQKKEKRERAEIRKRKRKQKKRKITFSDEYSVPTIYTFYKAFKIETILDNNLNFNYFSTKNFDLKDLRYQINAD